MNCKHCENGVCKIKGKQVNDFSCKDCVLKLPELDSNMFGDMGIFGDLFGGVGK